MEIESVYLLAKLIEKKLSGVLYSFFRYVPLSLSLSSAEAQGHGASECGRESCVKNISVFASALTLRSVIPITRH